MVFGFAAMLIENGWISEGDLSAAGAHAAREQVDLVDAVVALGLVDEHDSYAALSIVAGRDLVTLGEKEPSQLALQLVPAQLARRHLVVPVSVTNRLLTFATCRPNPHAELDVAFSCGRRTRMVVAPRSAVVAAIDRCYPAAHPLDPGAAHRAAPLAAAAAAAGPARTLQVLVTDDEPITRTLIRQLLEKQAYTVLEAADGREAVEIVARERPDLILIDLNMPGVDGYQAIAQIRADRSLAWMPILVLTGEEGPAVEDRVMQLGASDYLVKPFDPEVLLSRVNAVFHRREVVAA
jgi:CheY-like chemotaxis protein